MNKPTHPHTLSLLHNDLANVLRLKRGLGTPQLQRLEPQGHATHAPPRVTYKSSRADRLAPAVSPVGDAQSSDLWTQTTNAAAQAWAQLTGHELLSFEPEASAETRPKDKR